METKHLKVVFVIDESGSMIHAKNFVIGGINSYITLQYVDKTGLTTISLWKFNDIPKQVISNKTAIEIANERVYHDYKPEGTTALLDAIGMAINATHTEYFALSGNERPDKVLMVIITDGLENASRKFTFSNVRALINAHEEMGWEFVFLGSNLQDFKDADDLGIKNKAYSSRENMGDCFNSLSDSSTKYKQMKKLEEISFMADLLKDLNKAGKEDSEK